MTSFVYLLHFSAPISPHHTCQHYIGFTEDLPVRMQAHSLGHGARLLQVAKARGIRYQVARVWQGDRQMERKLKNRKEAPSLCPICNPKPPTVKNARELSPAEIQELLIPF